jgi:hypothetical protein
VLKELFQVQLWMIRKIEKLVITYQLAIVLPSGAIKKIAHRMNYIKK